MMTPADLPRFHTKVLLNALRSIRATRGNQLIDDSAEPLCEVKSQDESDKCELVPGYMLGLPYSREIDSTVTIADLKVELATRPHVPNKQEAAVIRQEKAHAKKHR